MPLHLEPEPDPNIILDKLESQYWDEKYGISLAGITADVIELEVQNPPTTKQQALQLAKEQFIYCPDIVYQGTQTIAALAAALLNGKVWFFWWD